VCIDKLKNMENNQLVNSRQPKQLYLLFFAEMWERFSFYGMRALLMVYMTSQLHFDDPKAYAILGSYAALVYTMPMFGGFIADRYWGYRKSVIIGGIMMGIGYCLMAVHSLPVLYSAWLALYIPKMTQEEIADFLFFIWV